MNRYAPGIAGLCFLACAAMAGFAYASALLRVYGPSARGWILSKTDAAYSATRAVLDWANVPQFYAGGIAVVILFWVVMFALTLDNRRFAR